jgi:hypothetical protein
MPADHAAHANATAAGWTRVQLDRGATAVPRFYSHYEKMIAGDASSGQLVILPGLDNTSQANADAAALAALNGFRRYRYGTDGTNVNKGRTGNTLTTDVS